ncbi:hypothetical protein ACTPEU_00465 [Clostridioides difficile]|uniref:hypothetical protein n=1 Tax=Clostridioides difficile TaxID=1496 RepID=UPI003F8D0080
MKILYTENLSKHYGKGESLVRALDNVDLEINEGEFVRYIGYAKIDIIAENNMCLLLS